MADVVLTSALRNNLLSLQLTQSLIDVTQLRLSTGKKVNSALDNPQSFFAAQSLSNRSGDLSNLLDGIGQSIQAVKAADKGAASLTKLVQQAESIANTAREEAANGAVAAGVTGTANLKGISDLVTNTSGISSGGQITLTVINDNNDVIQVNNATTGAAANAYTITFRPSSATLTEGDVTSVDQLLTELNGIKRNSDQSQLFQASLTSDGFLKITANDGFSYRVTFDSDGAAGANTASTDRALANSLGLGKFVTFAEATGAQTDANASRIALTASNKVALTSLKFTDNSTSAVATRATTLGNLRDDTNAARVTGDGAGDNLYIDVQLANGTRKRFGGAATAGDITGATALASATVGQIIDAVNADSTVKDFIKLGFNEETGQITIDALSADVIGATIGATSDNAGVAATANFGFGAFANTGTTQSDIAPAANAGLFSETENVFFAQGAGRLNDLKNQFGKLLDSIDSLVTDSQFAGTNLLAGDTLKTFFNEDRTSFLETVGQSLKSGDIGLTKDINFGSVASADAIIEDVKAALTKVRDFSSSLANDLSVIQTREDFTKGLIETLQEGADKLTLADQNEEGAKLLSLQTRQQLGVTSLSLAAQSQQAILRLF